jgi:cytochrome c oxidase assembly factor CtaG
MCHLSLAHWGVLLPFAIACLWYANGIAALDRAGRLKAVTGRARIVPFCVGLAVLLIALEGPVDEIADTLVSAHMVQHLLMILIAAPLVALSRPTPVFLWGLAPGPRRRVLRIWRHGATGRALRALYSPVVVWTAFCATFTFWHIPGPYRWALESEVVHAIEHLLLFVTALAFWSMVLESAGQRRLGYGATLIFIASTAVLSDLPGALLLFAPRPLYAVDPSGAAAWGLSPLQDQQLSGVVMWVPMGFAFAIAGAWVFMRWMESADRSDTRLRPQRAFPAVALLVAATAFAQLLARPVHAAEPSSETVGDAHHGAQLIEHYGCGYCHTIPGITNAKGRVGPPLAGFATRLYVAGMLPNTNENLIAWIENPQRIVPGNVMPFLGIGARDARDIAAYLRTLR